MNDLIYLPPPIYFFSSFATLTELIEVKIKWHQSASVLKTTNIKEGKGDTQKGSCKEKFREQYMERVRIC